ncbi:MAG: hypothetical protein V1743_05705 [Nanoarchaeota archaeon]
MKSLEKITQESAPISVGDIVYYEAILYVNKGQALSAKGLVDSKAMEALNVYVEKVTGREDSALEEIQSPLMVGLTVKEIRSGPYTFPWQEYHEEKDRTYDYTGLVFKELDAPAQYPHILKNGFPADLFYKKEHDVARLETPTRSEKPQHRYLKVITFSVMTAAVWGMIAYEYSKDLESTIGTALGGGIFPFLADYVSTRNPRRIPFLFKKRS